MHQCKSIHRREWTQVLGQRLVLNLILKVNILPSVTKVVKVEMKTIKSQNVGPFLFE